MTLAQDSWRLNRLYFLDRYQLFYCIGKDLRSPADLARFGKILGWNEKPIQVMSVTL